VSEPRDHHFIPAFYLRQWCNPTRADKLIEYSINHGKLVPKLVGPRATGFQRDLYAFPELPPDLAQLMERTFFNCADNVASAALQMLLSGNNRWTSKTRSGWSRFVIGIYLRHPDAFAELRAAAASGEWGSEGDVQRQYELVRRQCDPTTFDEYIAQNPPLGAKMELALIMQLHNASTIVRHVNNMAWEVVDVSAASHRLLTSDRPVDLDRLNLRAPGGAIMMPISPSKLFVAFNDPQALLYLRDLNSRRPRDIVGLANRKTIERARRYVWARDSSQQTFITKHMGKRREPLPLFPNLGEREGLSDGGRS
jgi:hypothetical protein